MGHYNNIHASRSADYKGALVLQAASLIHIVRYDVSGSPRFASPEKQKKKRAADGLRSLHRASKEGLQKI
ncbi:hypothetical protein FQN50_004600 [Emmonsiellopsis sp. PD_5]|nr:hypothetical protein FQN50_004600 [Emmonsiellopsis sp. PD_5]